MRQGQPFLFQMAEIPRLLQFPPPGVIASQLALTLQLSFTAACFGPLAWLKQGSLTRVPQTSTLGRFCLAHKARRAWPVNSCTPKWEGQIPAVCATRSPPKPRLFAPHTPILLAPPGSCSTDEPLSLPSDIRSLICVIWDIPGLLRPPKLLPLAATLPS
jgi:hypothetical protein